MKEQKEKSLTEQNFGNKTQKEDIYFYMRNI